MGTQTDKGYVPDIGESALVWPTPTNAGLLEHFEDGEHNLHLDPDKVWPDIWVNPDGTGDDLLSGSRPDLAKSHPQSAVDAIATNGGDIKVISSGRRARATDSPHIDLGSTPITITTQRHIRLFLGTSDFDGQGGGTGGHSMCWIRGSVANAALIQVRAAARFEMWGGGLENTGSGGIGLSTRLAVAYTLRKVETINCDVGFRHRTSGSDSSSMVDCVGAGGRIPLLIESTPSSDTAEYALTNRAAPNALHIIRGQYESGSQHCIACIADTGAGGLRGLRFVGVKMQHPTGGGNWDGAYTDRSMFLGRGISSADILGMYIEGDVDGLGTTNVPVYRFGAARGGSITAEGDWNTGIRIEGGEIHYLPDPATWTAVGLSNGVGIQVDADATRGLRVRDVGMYGLNANSLLSSSHPLTRLGSHTKLNKLDFHDVGSSSSRPDAIAKLINNSGTGNYGSWADPATDTAKNWGTQPS